jgi:putative oxidoreductase
MAQPSIAAKWPAQASRIQGVVRIVAAFVFMQSGTMKLFAFPVGVPPNGGTVPLISEAGLAGILEVFGGALLLLGLFTRPVAFLLAGEMAVAYFQFHFPQSFWLVVNGGTPAVLFCFLWLYLSAAGAGAWSLDGLREKGRLRLDLFHREDLGRDTRESGRSVEIARPRSS